MSVHHEPKRNRWVVRWRDAGRQRSRSFATEDEAIDFDREMRQSAPPDRPAEDRGARDARRDTDPPGVYPYDTRAGVRWRFVYRQSDGRLTTRRGFESRAAAQSARAIAVEEVRRGDIVVNRGTFGEFWESLIEVKRPYVTPGTLQDYKTHGRKRLLPWFGELRLSAIDEDCVREWIGDMAELVADGELRPKTVNNARSCLSMTLGEAVRRRHLSQNPCRYVPELPADRPEIERYPDACAERYRALAEFLIGTGTRITHSSRDSQPRRGRRSRRSPCPTTSIPVTADASVCRS